MYSLKKNCAIAIQQQNIDPTTLPFVLQKYIKREIQDCCTYKVKGPFVYVLKPPEPPTKYGDHERYQFDCAIKSSKAMEGIMSIPATLGHIDCMWKMKHHGFNFNYDKRYGQDCCCPYRYYHFDCIKFLIDHNQIKFQYVIAENIRTIPLNELKYIVTKCDFQPSATDYVLKRAVDSKREDVLDFLSNFRSSSLNLSGNRLTSLRFTIGNMTELKELYLNGNLLTSLPDTIGNLTHLKKLTLYYNELTSLPDTVGNLAELRELDLAWNRLTSLPDTIGNLTQLSTLNVFHNRLTSLPESIGNLVQLTKLYVNENQLTSLPDTIGNLVQLSELHLGRNQLTSLPSTIGNLVQYVNVNENQLTSLPDTIGNLVQLSELHLNNNQLTSLPESIGNLVQLTKLCVNCNQLTSLPDTIGNLARLSTLDVRYNNLSSLPQSITQLDILNLSLSNNSFSKLSEDGFQTRIFKF